MSPLTASLKRLAERALSLRADTRAFDDNDPQTRASREDVIKATDFIVAAEQRLALLVSLDELAELAKSIGRSIESSADDRFARIVVRDLNPESSIAPLYFARSVERAGSAADAEREVISRCRAALESKGRDF